jgi:3-hydroxyisobutyrate dehydrogenase-like beta-hydroxyacid dehydrogenase
MHLVAPEASRVQEEEAMRIGVVGAGRMGWPMALRLSDAGHDVGVLTRNDPASTRAHAAGLRAAPTIAETCRGAQVVIVCVFTDAQVRETCLGADGIVESVDIGASIVIHTTGSPTTAEEVADAAGRRDVAVLDGPVSGGPTDVAAGRVTLFVGGDEASLAAVRPALGTYGSPIVHAGPVGYGQRVKLVNNALFAANIATAAGAMRLGNDLGVDDRVLLDALRNGSSGRPAIAILAGAGSVARLAASLGEFLSKDVAMVRAVADRLGADLGVLGDVLSSDYVPEALLG